MQLWRISNYASLTGEGGVFFEGRWHTVGRPIVYLAASPAGALVEILVHLELDDTPPPEQYQLLQIEAPDSLAIEDIVPEQPPLQPCGLELAVARSRGDAWLRTRGAPLARVPSAILPSTWNYLLNPMHPDATQFQIRNICSAKHDPRLFRKMR